MMHLRGLTNYGDSVDDEWLIVYILKELSKRFIELWVKVKDTDGEFLLIEAANALPRWLNPEIADNRVRDTPHVTAPANILQVWINHGTLRIIPLNAAHVSSNQTGSISRSLSLEEALGIISPKADSLIHSPLIEAEAFYRLRNYPSQITASLHHSTITIPRKLAYILHDRAPSIAPAVEAFYLRDPIALKTLHTSSDLIFPPEDLVTVSARFTKVLYAQLKSQQFSTPASWKNIFAESENIFTSELLTSKKHANIEMGMKVTSGFEMLLRDSKNDDNRLVREVKIILDDLAADNNADLPTDEDIAKWEGVGREDDEKWLDINFEDFERELQGKGHDKKPTEIPGVFGPAPPSGFGDAKTEADLKKMVERFQDFMNDDTAGEEGAELDDMDVDDDTDTDNESNEEDKEVSFDENEFAKLMREMMGLPSDEHDEIVERPPPPMVGRKLEGGRVEDIDSDNEDDGDDEDAKIREVMQRIEAELNEGGALNLDPTPQKLFAPREKVQLDRENNPSNAQDKDKDEDETDEEVDIDFNLVKNLLESFKSQAGMAGPGGNLMGMMGLQLPRDEDDTAPAGKKP